MSGTFTYQRRALNKIISWLVMILTLVGAWVVRLRGGNTAMICGAFVASFLVLTIVSIPVVQRWVVQTGRYEIDEQTVRFEMGHILEIPRAELTQVTFGGAREFGVSAKNSDRVYALVLYRGEKSHAIYSETRSNNPRTGESIDTLREIARFLGGNING